MSNEMKKIIGVDENNYSPCLAGDVVVTALYALEKVEGVMDCKQMSRPDLYRVFEELQETSLYYVSFCPVPVIEKVNVYWARNCGIWSVMNAMLTLLKRESLEVLDIQIDGQISRALCKHWSETLSVPVTGVKYGDDNVYEISAASIVGRVYADAWFAGMQSLFPRYVIKSGHGRLSKEHHQSILTVGPSPFDREGVYGQDWWKRILGKEVNP